MGTSGSSGRPWRPGQVLAATLACLIGPGSVAYGATLPLPASAYASAYPASRHHAELTTRPASVLAGEPAELEFAVKDSMGRNVRFLEFVHERPMHLIVVSRDLAEFDHIHPELSLGDVYTVTHSFRHGGAYRLFADYTPPGAGTIVDRFDVGAGGRRRAFQRLVPDPSLSRCVDGVRISLSTDRPLRAGEDVTLLASLADSATARPVTDLQLYLGALAHFILISQDLSQFIHAHPLETGEVYDPSQDPSRAHVHDTALLAKVLVGPSPSVVRAVTNFPGKGLYKLWVQFQRGGRVSTVPFVLLVEPGRPVGMRIATQVPLGAIRVSVGSSGYSPSRIEIPSGRPAVLAFTRPRGGNCGGEVVIPGLGIRRNLPVGGTVLIPIGPRDKGEIPFHCGADMYQGVISVR